MSTKHIYQGSLQERLRNLSLRTNCPTRQENGQRYLGPPVDWIEKSPTNAEIFISKLPADCYEDEIYDFCSQVGKIYLIRLMINFENENRGFCFVTFSSSKEASEAVAVLPQNPLRKGHYVHAEISFNNCTLKMYGLDFRWNDENLEQEIRTNTKDVVNVTIKRNMVQRTLMATLYFDTHQKAAIARRKLSQIANSRWGQNVKVFLWSKKLQNKGVSKQESPNEKSYKKKSDRSDNDSPLKDSKRDYEFDIMHQESNDGYNSPDKSFTSDTSPFQQFSAWNSSIFSPRKQQFDYADNYFSNDSFLKPDNALDSAKSLEQLKKIDDALKAYENNFDVFSTCDSPSSPRTFSTFGTPPGGNSFTNYMTDNTNSLFSNESSPGGYSKSSTDSDIFGVCASNWNYDHDFVDQTSRSHFNEQTYKNELADSFYANLPEKQIETILQEALQTLTLNKCNDQQFFL